MKTHSPCAAARPLPPPGRRLGYFLVVGAIGFAVDAGLTVALTIVAGWSPYIARLPAAAIAIVVTWALNRMFTFASSDPHRVAELTRYGAVSGVSAALNYAAFCIFLLAAGSFGVDVRAAGAVLAGTIAGSLLAAANTYCLSSLFAFRRTGAG